VLPPDDQDVVYLTIDDVLAVYAEIFGCSDAEARLCLRASDILESALDRPKQYAYYQGADLLLQAVVMAHGIAEGQPFLDGNKRTAAIALELFLDLNGLELTLSNEDLATYIWWFSEGLSSADFVDLVRPHNEPRG
jgi:death-on-curing protein